MRLPFTPEQFFNVFAQYNLAVWPMQIVIYLLALAAVFLALRKMNHSDRIISIILACLWLWIGLIYHLTFFTAINPAAYIFGGLFIAQGLLFFVAGVWPQKITFAPHINLYVNMGAFFILYGMLIYPVLGYFLGHVYPHSPTFGLPCPTTIFTFGLLLWSDRPLPKYLLLIPLIWSLIGFQAATQLGVLEDIMLLIAALVATTLIWYRDRTTGKFKPSFSA
jgi:hypothetical protein